MEEFQKILQTQYLSIQICPASKTEPYHPRLQGRSGIPDKVKKVNEELTARHTQLPNVAIIGADGPGLGAVRVSAMELPLTLAGRSSESSSIVLDAGAAQDIAANVPFLATVRSRAEIRVSEGSVILLVAPRRVARTEPALTTRPDQALDLLIIQAGSLAGRSLPPDVARACEAGLLALLSVAQEREAGEPAGDPLFRDILADIAANCRQQDYGVAQVAQRYKLNVRTLQKMFQKHGTKLSEHITAARLKYAGAALLDPANAGRKVSDIAFEAGFNDIATFNRLFRKTFGRAPSAFRTEAAQAAASVARAEETEVGLTG